MENIVVYRDPHDVLDELGFNQSLFTKKTMPNGQWAWKRIKGRRFSASPVQMNYWMLPREMWRVCTACQKSLLDETEGKKQLMNIANRPGLHHITEELDNDVPFYLYDSEVTEMLARKRVQQRNPEPDGSN